MKASEAMKEAKVGASLTPYIPTLIEPTVPMEYFPQTEYEADVLQNYLDKSWALFRRLEEILSFVSEEPFVVRGEQERLGRLSKEISKLLSDSSAVMGA